MSYTKQTWVNGEIITDSKLNHMEDGIAAGGSAFIVSVTESYDDSTGATTYTANKSYNEVKTAILGGQNVWNVWTDEFDTTHRETVVSLMEGEDDGVPYYMVYDGTGKSYSSSSATDPLVFTQS